MKAADIPDSAIYALVAAVSPRWATRWDIQGHFPQMPEKVVLAKLRQMVNKGRLNGCGCGCRGDFTVPPHVLTGLTGTLTVNGQPVAGVTATITFKK